MKIHWSFVNIKRKYTEDKKMNTKDMNNKITYLDKTDNFIYKHQTKFDCKS